MVEATDVVVDATEGVLFDGLEIGGGGGPRMGSLFISHASSDKAEAGRVAAWLKDRGFSSIFLDFDPEIGIPMGRDWEREIYAELRRADAIVFLGSHASLESKWCHTELAIARSMRKKIFPVLLEPGAEHPLIRDTQWVGIEDGAADARPHLLRALTSEGITARDALAWDPDIPPYPGLQAFEENRAGVFFGRDREINALLRRVGRRYADPADRFIAVIGPSGSGKSSLVRAGVVPRLKRMEGRWVVVPPFRPGRDPVEAMARKVATAFRSRGHEIPWETCRDRMMGDHGQLGSLMRDLLESEGRSEDSSGILIIDQAEELAAPDVAPQRRVFLEILQRSLQEAPAFWVIATIRSESLSAILEQTTMDGLIGEPFLVAPLGPERLPEVIESPAQRSGIEFEPGLVQRIVQETVSGSPAGRGVDALPLLAFTLRRLYDEPRADPIRITVADYERVGGVVAALKREADLVYEDLHRSGRGSEVLPTLMLLVTLGERAQPSARTVGLEDLRADQREIVDAFVQARLVTSAEGAVHVSHEALFREWPRLHRAIEDATDDLLTRSRLERDAAEWRAADREPSYLLSGQRLSSARRWMLHSASDPATRDVRDYVAASQQRARQSRRGRSVTVALLAIVTLTLVALGAARLAGAVQHGLRVSAAKGDMVRFPEGDAPLGADRTPVRLAAFSLDRFEVSYGRYRLCVEDGVCSRPLETPDTIGIDRADERLPVGYVNAYPAADFCRWLGQRLPTEPEWERAVRGDRYRLWPWGDDAPATGGVNVLAAGAAGPPGGPVPVDDPRYSDGWTPEQVAHLVGNVREWTSTPTSGTCPYTACPEWDGSQQILAVTIVGFGWLSDDLASEEPDLLAGLIPSEPQVTAEDNGFRCAAD